MPFWKRQRKRPEARPTARRTGCDYGLVTDLGRVRPTNQDHAFAMSTSLPSPSGQISLGLFLVADGLGGHAGGATASARAVETAAGHVFQGLLLPIMRGEPSEAIQDVLQGAVFEANRRVRWEGLREGNDMGTTLTAALVVGERCYVAHVGDSRLYSYGTAGLKCWTRDHSMVARLLELGQISAEEARHHPKRNYLYQSVGQQEEIDVEAASFPLADCSHLLLCSDGLWGSLSEEELIRVLNGEGTPQEMCQQLVELANEAGGEDNITVVVVTMAPGPPDAGGQGPSREP